MAVVQGSRVRHRAAARGWDLPTLATKAGIPKGTLRNNLRTHNPQQIHLTRVYSLARALRNEGEDVERLVRYFTGEEEVPDQPPSQPPGPGEPKEPGRKEKAGKGPRRTESWMSA
ncbi:MAG TPA: hypothetical protein VJQ57_13090 [Acidimicrobiia bacterium]|nr:hypothetical protein [Acidimicrobiia bacterium]